MTFDSTHIDKCSREVTRWSRAIRSIHVLENGLNLSKLPEPDLIVPFRRPFDLGLIWEVQNRNHSEKIRKRIATVFGLGIRWAYSEHPGYWTIKTRVKLQDKQSIMLALLVNNGQGDCPKLTCGLGSRD